MDSVNEALPKIQEILAQINDIGALRELQRNFDIAVSDRKNELLEKESEADKKVRAIIEDLKATVPPNAESPDEKIIIPKTKTFKDYTLKNTLHVDCFLFPNDEDIDDLCEEGEMNRDYCGDCGSRNVVPLNFVSHSASLLQLKFIFSESGFGDLSGKKLVDVGSRLGAVLYTGYHYSKATELIGIEKNKWFGDLQKKMAKKHSMSDRIKVICDDVLNCAAVLQDADAVVMNNVFEFFVSDKKAHAALWTFIKSNLKKKGAKLVTIPPLDQALREAGINMQLDDWVERLDVEYPHTFDEGEQEDYEMIAVYRVL